MLYSFSYVAKQFNGILHPVVLQKIYINWTKNFKSINFFSATMMMYVLYLFPSSLSIFFSKK